jgi:hypothetical protein
LGVVPDRTLTWNHAKLDAGGRLTVPIEPEVDESWVSAFECVGRNIQRETRGQQFREVRFEEARFLVVEGVPVGEPKPTADFFDVWVVQANQFERQRHERLVAAVKQSEQQHVHNEQAAQRSTQALRERA